MQLPGLYFTNLENTPLLGGLIGSSSDLQMSDRDVEIGLVSSSRFNQELEVDEKLCSMVKTQLKKRRFLPIFMFSRAEFDSPSLFEYKSLRVSSEEDDSEEEDRSLLSDEERECFADDEKLSSDEQYGLEDDGEGLGFSIFQLELVFFNEVFPPIKLNLNKFKYFFALFYDQDIIFRIANIFLSRFFGANFSLHDVPDACRFISLCLVLKLLDDMDNTNHYLWERFLFIADRKKISLTQVKHMERVFLRKINYDLSIPSEIAQ